MEHSAARDEVSRGMRRIRARALLRWRQRIGDEIPCSAMLTEPVLFNAMPELYDYLTLSIADPDALARTSLARAHGADRARQTGYRPVDLLREFQVLRRCMAEIAEEEDLGLTRQHMAALAASFDSAERAALDEYDIVTRREHDMVARTLAATLREHLNVIGISAQRIIATGNPARIAELANRIRGRLARIETALADQHEHEGANPERLPLLLSTFDLTALARETCREANHPGTSVHGDAVTVTWCRMSVRRALRNLLAEGGAAGPVSITVRQANGRAVVSVLHRHVLPADVVRTLFSARNKESHPTLREWGVGLGFVRDVAESHGGSAIVHSADTAGTEFRLDLPIDASPFLGAAS
jgi:signal transduction histidine kinase